MTLYIGNDEISKKIILENISGGGIDLPEISEITKGKILGNDGSTLSWVDESDYIASEFNQTLDISSVTNCITKIPQDIKLELVDGTLTLKAGSIAYDGAGNVINFNKDYVVDSLASPPDVVGVYYSKTQDKVWANQPMSLTTSGETPPPRTGMFYNTITKSVDYYNNGTLSDSDWSFPLATISTLNGQVTSINQIFNGFGYIGSTFFVLPGVEGLIPNGFDTEGNLNNVKIINENVLTLTPSFNGDSVLLLGNNNFTAWGKTDYSYQYNKNFVYFKDGNHYALCKVGEYYKDSTGRITSLTPKTTFQAVDYNDYNEYSKDITEIKESVSDKVSLTKDEEISGIKTFTNNITAPNQIDYTNITNCITKIPQDIKLELVDGTLTLKAGSMVYTADDNFVRITEDKVLEQAGTHTNAVMFYIPSLDVFTSTLLDKIFSGDNPPDNPTNLDLWYDTALIMLKVYINSYWTECALPIGLFSNSNGSVTSIDQVFNGFGYIGSIVFALPGVEGLIPNGRNADGSLNNVKYTMPSVAIYTNSVKRTNAKLSIGPSGTLDKIIIRNTLTYNSDINFNYNGTTNALELNCGIITSDSTGRITSFSPKTVFHAVDRNDTEWASTASKPSNKYVDLTLQASGASYTAPANGWFYTKYTKNSETATQSMILGFTSEDIDGLGNFITMGMNSLVTNTFYRINQPIKAGKKMRFSYQKANANDTIILGFCYDEGAK